MVLETDMSVIAAVGSTSLKYFDEDSTTHGALSSYQGLVRVASSGHSYLFKKGFESNLNFYQYLKPSAMALNEDESNLAIVYSDENNQKVNTLELRFAIVMVDTLTG